MLLLRILPKIRAELTNVCCAALVRFDAANLSLEIVAAP